MKKEEITDVEELKQVAGGACPRVLEPLIGDTSSAASAVANVADSALNVLSASVKPAD